VVFDPVTCVCNCISYTGCKRLSYIIIHFKQMKKSKLFFAAAIFVWLLGITYSLLNIVGPKSFKSFNEKAFSGFTPFIVFIFIFMGIVIGKKAGELYNVENGRAANYRPARTKAQHTGLYAVLIGFALIAVVLIATQLIVR